MRAAALTRAGPPQKASKPQALKEVDVYLPGAVRSPFHPSLSLSRAAQLRSKLLLRLGLGVRLRRRGQGRQPAKDLRRQELGLRCRPGLAILLRDLPGNPRHADARHDAVQRGYRRRRLSQRSLLRDLPLLGRRCMVRARMLSNSLTSCSQFDPQSGALSQASRSQNNGCADTNTATTGCCYSLATSST